MDKNHTKSASGEHDEWIKCCLAAGSSETVLSTFRSIPIVQQVVDGHPLYALNQYLYRIKKIINDKDLLVKIVSEWSSSDSICSPQTIKNISLYGRRYLITPATGRHIINVLNYFNLLKDKGNIKICEIGAGWGGSTNYLINYAPHF
jgi:hypothetical protein